MADEGSSSHEVCLSETSWVFLNSDVDNSSGSGNSPSGNSDKTTPPSSTVSTPTGAGTETKELPAPEAKTSRASTKKRGHHGGSENKGSKSESTKEGGSDEAEHDIHILTERERRKKMRNMFANLHALLPQLSQKADKSSIVDEAVRYIKKLQGDLQCLEQRKLERLQNTTTPVTMNDPFSASSSSLIPYNTTNTITREAFLADQVSSSNNINDGSFIPSANSSLNSSPITKFPVAFQIWTSSNVVLTVCGVEAQFNIVSAKKFGVLSAIFFVLDKYNIDVMAASISSLPDSSTNYMIMAQARGAQHQSLELFSLEDIYRQAAVEIMEWTSS